MTDRSPLAHPTADAAACDRYDCGHIARHADRTIRHAGILFALVRRHGAGILSGIEADPATVVALGLMRQGLACREVADRYRDPVNGRMVAAAPRRERSTLTTGQTAVLRALATGATPREVAPTLGLDAETVISHRKNAYRALSVHSLADAVAEAVAQGYAVL